MPIGFSSGSFEEISEGLYRVDLSQGFATSRYSSGMEKLVFEVIYFLLTTKGSIPTDPTIGTRLRGFIGTLNLGRNPDGEAATLIADEVSRAAEIIRSRQVSSGLNAGELLKSIHVEQVVLDRDTQSASVRLVITNKEKQAVGFEIAIK